MSNLQKLNKAELAKLVDKFEVKGLDENSLKPDIINALENEGVTYETYKKFFIDSNSDPEYDEGGTMPPAASYFEAKPVLLKMDRENGTFEAYGQMFTREHPYALVSEEIAQTIIDEFPGFRLASPTEAKTYYN